MIPRRRAVAVLAMAAVTAGCAANPSPGGGGGPIRSVRAFAAQLSGAEVVPPVGGGGSGTAAVTLYPGGKWMTWEVDYVGLSGPATAAHFHGPAAAGANAGVAVGLGPNLDSPIVGSAEVTDAQAADLVAGRWYVNIHTAANPNGELRGQVTPVH